MKQTMFALACAAVCVAGADEINSVNFEDYTNVGPLLSNGYDDNGSAVEANPPETAFFVYEASSSSADGSTVAAHENVSASTGWEDKSFGSKYLALSTEGGTLWRSIKHASVETVTETDGDGNSTSKLLWKTGEQQTVPDTGLYIDTMVQFTPTEDGSKPDDLGEDAKLAIWLNVTQPNDGPATTNLCVRGGILSSDLTSFYPTNFTLVAATGSAPNVRPGEWYRLTVRALTVADMGEGNVWIGFQIKLNNVDLKPSVNPYDVPYGEGSFLDFLSSGGSEQGFSSDIVDSILAGKIVPSLGNNSKSELSAVGFKGSGAIDDFCVTDEEPSFTAATVTTVDFMLTWGEGVSSVTYTIEGETSQSATKADGTEIKVPKGKKVTVAATPDDWYKITEGTVGEFIVNEDMAQTITAELEKSLTNLGITGFDPSVSATDVKKWADGKNISLSALQGSSYAYNSFLLGTDLLTTDPVLTIDDVTVADGQMTITVAAKKGEADEGDVINLEGIYGVLYVKTGDTLDDMKNTEVLFDAVDTTADPTGDTKLTVTLDADAGKFAQVKIGAKPQPVE